MPAVSADTAGKTLHEDAAIRLWTLDDEVIIASIKSKMHTISAEVTAGLAKGLELAEQGYKGLVIWSQDGPFSAGADLQSMMPAFMQGGGKAIAPFEKQLQDFMLSLRYSNVPSVAAVHGLALGGGCELAVHASKRVAAMESYVGLVEVGVGLIPGGGGLAYLARRAAEQLEGSKGVSGQVGGDLIGYVKEGFQAAAMAKVATSAIEARTHWAKSTANSSTAIRSPEPQRMPPARCWSSWGSGSQASWSCSATLIVWCSPSRRVNDDVHGL